MVKTASFLLMLFVAQCFFVVQCYSVEGRGTNPFESNITMQFDNEPMSKVLKKISVQTGVSIMYDVRFSTDKVSGDFKGISVEDAVNRLFKGVNKILTVVEGENVLVIETHGAKRYALAAALSSDLSAGQGVFDGMPYREVILLQRKQYAAYLEELKDMEQIEPGTDKTRGEVLKIHQIEGEQYKKSLAAGDSIIPGGDKTEGEVIKLQEEMYKEYLRNEQNMDAKAMGVDMTKKSVREKHEKQYSEYTESMKRGDEFLPDVGMTESELKRSHEAQAKARLKEIE